MPDLDKGHISNLLDEYKKISNDKDWNPRFEYGLFDNKDVQADVFKMAGVEPTGENIKAFTEIAKGYEEDIKKDVDDIVANFNNDFEQAKKGEEYIGYSDSDIGGEVMIKVLTGSEGLKKEQASSKMNEKMDKEERKQARGHIRSFGHKVLKIVGLSSSDSNRPNFAKQGGDSPKKGPKNG